MRWIESVGAKVRFLPAYGPDFNPIEAMFAKRKGMIEPILGQLKPVLSFHRFSLRGPGSMRGEWRLMATVHNLLKIWRHDPRVAVAGVST